MKSEKPSKEMFPREGVNNNALALKKKKRGVKIKKNFYTYKFQVHYCINNLYNQKYSQNKDLMSMRLF